MASNLNKDMDGIDRRLISLLAENSRISIRDLAQNVGMSSPAISDRLRRLEEAGIIRRYTVELDEAALGYTLQAIVRVRPLPGHLHTVEKRIREIPECVECDKVTGDDCFIMRLCLPSIESLDPILTGLLEKAQTSSYIVKGTPVKRRIPAFLPR